MKRFASGAIEALGSAVGAWLLSAAGGAALSWVAHQLYGWLHASNG